MAMLIMNVLSKTTAVQYVLVRIRLMSVIVMPKNVQTVIILTIIWGPHLMLTIVRGVQLVLFINIVLTRRKIKFDIQNSNPYMQYASTYRAYSLISPVLN